MLDQNTIKQMAARLEIVSQDVKERQEDLKSITDAVNGAGCDAAAFKLAVKLSKMAAGKSKHFLDSLDACRLALSLDAQLDIEDAIASGLDDLADAAQKIPADPGDRDTVRIGNGPEIPFSSFKKAAKALERHGA